VEEKMFSPMVITLMLALASAFLLSVTFVPAMAAILLHGKVAENEVYSIRVAKHLYAPALRTALAHPLWVVAAGIVTFGAAVIVSGSLGREFIPTLDEINVCGKTRRTGVSCIFICVTAARNTTSGRARIRGVG
jgi:cobalt-zinc-cadmium resistance protein CzcA